MLTYFLGDMRDMVGREELTAVVLETRLARLPEFVADLPRVCAADSVCAVCVERAIEAGLPEVAGLIVYQAADIHNLKARLSMLTAGEADDPA